MTFSKFPVLFGNYLLAHRVASGGMADVYCARAAAGDIQRLVAIKCMRADLCQDEAFASMFIDEAKLAAQLTHANVVQIFDLGRVDEQLFIAMELVQGRDLGNIIKTAGKLAEELPLGVCAYIIAKAAEALDVAHDTKGMSGTSLNLVHSDISPQNILVSFDGEVKVVDFGIARAGGKGSGSLEGKFAYMAPEQALRGEIDKRADIFALGTVLFELVTGERLFEAESRFGVLEKVRGAEIPDLEMSDPRIRGDLAQLLHRALAKDPRDRFDRAMELSEALTPLMIEKNTIVGARQTAELMRRLYAGTIESEAERLKRAVELSPDPPPADKPSLGSVEIIAAGSTVPPEEELDVDVDIVLEDEPALHVPMDADGELLDLSGRTPVIYPSRMEETEAEAAAALAEKVLPRDTPSAAHALEREPVADELAALAAAPARSSRTGLLVGLLIGLVAIGAAGYLVVWPRVRPMLDRTSIDLAAGPVAATAPEPSPEENAEVADEPLHDHEIDEEREEEVGQGKRARYGYIAVRTPGIKARVFIDGREIHRSRRVVRVRTGQRKITVVEKAGSASGRSRIKEVRVGASHTKTSPLTVVIRL